QPTPAGHLHHSSGKRSRGSSGWSCFTVTKNARPGLGYPHRVAHMGLTTFGQEFFVDISLT
ncbi:MAG: hypothetical protein ACRC6D_02435, partial [Aeromonas sp.]